MSLHTYLMIKQADPRNLNRSEYADDIAAPLTSRQRAKEDKAGNPYISGLTIRRPVEVGVPGTVFRDDGSGVNRRSAPGYHYHTEERDVPMMTHVPGYGYFAEDYPGVPGLPFASEAKPKRRKPLDNFDWITSDDDSPLPVSSRDDWTSTGSYEDTGWLGSTTKPMWEKGRWNWAQDGRSTPGIFWGRNPKYGPSDKTYDSMARAISELGDSNPMFENLFLNDYRLKDGRVDRHKGKLPDVSDLNMDDYTPIALPALKRYRPDAFED